MIFLAESLVAFLWPDLAQIAHPKCDNFSCALITRLTHDGVHISIRQTRKVGFTGRTCCGGHSFQRHGGKRSAPQKCVRREQIMLIQNKHNRDATDMRQRCDGDATQRRCSVGMLVSCFLQHPDKGNQIMPARRRFRRACQGALLNCPNSSSSQSSSLDIDTVNMLL